MIPARSPTAAGMGAPATDGHDLFGRTYQTWNLRFLELFVFRAIGLAP